MKTGESITPIDASISMSTEVRHGIWSRLQVWRDSLHSNKVGPRSLE